MTIITGSKYNNSVTFGAIMFPNYSNKAKTAINDSAEILEYLKYIRTVVNVQKGVERVSDKPRILTCIKTCYGSKFEKYVVDVLNSFGVKEIKTADHQTADKSVARLDYLRRNLSRGGF